jgi:hypothetical protein
MTLKLAIGLPAYRGQIASAHAVMWAQFGAACARQPDDVQIVMLGYVDTCGIDRARNALVRQATTARADWLLMVDSDTFAVTGKDLLRMLLERPSDAAAVGAPVIRRGQLTAITNIAPEHVANIWRWTGERHEPTSIRNGGIGSHGFYTKVDAVGAAIFAVDLTRAASAHAEFRWADGMSEDLYFCRQLRLAGERIYVDPRVATVHLGQPEILTYNPDSTPPSGGVSRSGKAGP